MKKPESDEQINRFPSRYDDPYEEPIIPPRRLHANASPAAASSFDLDLRPPVDGASARRDFPPPPPSSADSMTCQNDDENSDDDGDDSRHVSSHASCAHVDPSVGNYDAPWDLTSKCRMLEDRLRELPVQLSRVASAEQAAKPSSSTEKDDCRVLADGYDRPWDLQPHRRDERDDVGYDRPWDLRPHEKDLRSSGEYDSPWDVAKGCREAVLVAKVTHADVAAVEYDEPWDQRHKQLLNRATLMTSATPGCNSSTAAVPAAVAATSGSTDSIIDPRIPLLQQSWYHGSVSRVEAESVLRAHRDGSFLVRTSESNRQDFSLSVKTARGFMHMKIATETTDGGTVRYILGQFSHPFVSISHMIHHYSRHKLPVKGAEHLCLLHPVSSELL